MRKLKKFSLSGRILSDEEMSKVCGMTFVAFDCYSEGQSCAVYASGGVNTGTCKWSYADMATKYLVCSID